MAGRHLIHHAGILPGALGHSHQAPLAAYTPKGMVSPFLALIKRAQKSKWKRKEEKVPLWQRFSGAGGRAWSQAGLCFCSCLTKLVGQPAPTPLVPLG